MRFEMRQVDNSQGLMVRRIQMYGRRDAHLPGFFPAGRAQAPAIAGLQAWKLKLWARRDEIIAAVKTVIEEFGGHGHADCMHAMIHRARIAAAIAKETSLGIVAAWGERFAHNIAGFCLCLAHTVTGLSGLLAAAFKTPQ